MCSIFKNYRTKNKQFSKIKTKMMKKKILKLEYYNEKSLKVNKKVKIKKVSNLYFERLYTNWNDFIKIYKEKNKDYIEEEQDKVKKMYSDLFFRIDFDNTLNDFSISKIYKKDGINIISRKEESLNKNWYCYNVYNKTLKSKNSNRLLITLKDVNKDFKNITLNFLKNSFFEFTLKKNLFLSLLKKKSLFFFHNKFLIKNLKQTLLYCWKENILYVLSMINNNIAFTQYYKNFLNNSQISLNKIFGVISSKSKYSDLTVFKKRIFFIQIPLFMRNDLSKKYLSILLKDFNIKEEIFFFQNKKFLNILFMLSYFFKYYKFNKLENKKEIKLFSNKLNNYFYIKQIKYYFQQTVSANFSKNLKKKILKVFKYNFEKNENFQQNKFIRFYQKKSTLGFRKYLQNQKLWKRNILYSQNKVQRPISFSYIYLIKKLSQKVEQNNEKKESLLGLRNFLYQNWLKKIKRQRCFNFSILKTNKIRKFLALLRKKWMHIFQYLFLNFVKKNKGNIIINKNEKMKTFLSNIFCNLKLKKTNQQIRNRLKHKNKLFNKQNILIKNSKNIKYITWKKKRKKIRLLFKEKKIIKKNSYLPFRRQKELLFFLLKRKVSIYYINTLSLSRFGFTRGITKKTSKLYLQSIEREMINRYKYIAIYIKDLVQIGFISLFLKKATFLANFIAFQIEKLPRNRKETKFIRFIIKVVKIFAAQRKEMKGLRIKFKGRVNRWRRTKSIVGERGLLHYYTYDSRIEYGTSKAITRKGTLGISIWLRYSAVFPKQLLKTIFDYQKYSKNLRWKTLTKFYKQFKVEKTS